jgi:ABC-type nitrate/sulfonate/bicarbonate transport system substrate-binding protein
MYWFLIMRSDLHARRGDIAAVKGKRIGAAPWVEMGLRRLLIEAGIDLDRDAVTIQPVPGAIGEKANFGLMAAQALADGTIDGFWANGMGADVAQRSGAGTLVLDVRRGDGPPACFNYTLASVAATDALIARSPDVAAAAVRAIVATQKALIADVGLATNVGRAIFPAAEADLIAAIVERDLPYYDATISPETVAGMNAFARDMGILDREVPYADVVATAYRTEWRS